MNYRFLRKQKTLALGVYPAVPLAAACKGRDQARELLAAGKAPSAERREAGCAGRSGSSNSPSCWPVSYT